MTRKILATGLLLTTALTQANASSAQDVAPIDLGVIRIGVTEAQALLGNNEITEDQIDARNASTTKDVFAGESSVTAGGGAAIAQKVFVNGVEESLLSVTIDGARQNKSAFHHTGNVLLDPELLKRVEVTEGLAPADAGPGGLGGSIAYETKDASDLLDPGDPFGGFVKLSGSDNGGSFDKTLALFGQTGGFEFLLSATDRESSDYEDGDGATVPGTGADLQDYMAKFAYTSESGHRLEFAASQTEDTGLRVGQAGPGGIIFLRPDFAGVVGATSVLTPGLSRRTSYTLTYTNEQAAGIWDPTLQLSYNEQEIDAGGVYGVNDSLSGFAKNEFQIGNGTVTVGLDFFQESAEGLGRGPGVFASSGREELSNVGVFAQARQDIGERISLSYGARYDSQSFTGADGSEFSDQGFSANASVDVILNDYLTLNAGLASTWGGFELGEAALVNFGTAWDYTGFTTSQSRSGRIGLRFEKGAWAISAAYFDTQVSDIAAVLPTDGARGALSDLRSRGSMHRSAMTLTIGLPTSMSPMPT